MFISQGGCYGDINLKGVNPALMQNDVALRVHTPFHQETIIEYLKIRDCGLPLRHTNGKLKITTLDCKRFTADLLNSHGDLEIENLIVEYDNPDFIYSDNYHVDALGQFFDNINKVVSNVKIHNIHARIKGPKIQGFMLSEDHDYYNFKIGTGKVDIKLDYKYAFVANTLRDSFINVGNNGVKIKNVKRSKYNSDNVKIIMYNDQLIVSDFDINQRKENISMANYELGRKSKSELVGVHPLLAACAWLSITDPDREYDCSVFDGVRTQKEQDFYLAKGTSKTSFSRHQLGQAVDLVPYINGRVRWDSEDTAMQAKITASFDENIRLMDKHARALGITLKRFKWDKPHHQIENSDYDIRKLMVKLSND